MREQIGIAVGQMGMSLDTFYRLSPQQFQEAYDAWLLKVNAEREHFERIKWEVARWQVWRTMCPPKLKGQVSVMDVLKLPGDDELLKQERKKQKPSTRNRYEQLKNKWSNG